MSRTRCAAPWPQPAPIRPGLNSNSARPSWPKAASPCVSAWAGSRRWGLRLVIDDYGSGSSSLSAIKRFGIDALKIDRSFVGALVSDAGSANLVRATIGIAENLGLRVQAEGVETDQVASELRGMGCAIAQGYGLGRPLPADQFRQLVGIA